MVKLNIKFEMKEMKKIRVMLINENRNMNRWKKTLHKNSINKITITSNNLTINYINVNEYSESET